MKDKEKEISVEDIRYFRFGMWFMLACFVVTGISVGLIYLKHTIPLPNKNSYTTDGTKIHRMILAGKHYYVPENYILLPYSKTGFVIEILFPDMEPRTKENIKIFLEPNRSNGRRSHILINDALETTTLLFKYNVQLEHYSKHTELPNEYGVKKQQVSRLHLTPNVRMRYINEIYLYTELNRSNAMVSYIKCEYLASSPSCGHRFNYNNLEIKVTYSMDRLPEWQAIRSKVVNLIESFKTIPKTSVKGDK